MTNPAAARRAKARIATAADLETIVDTLTTAFEHDPLWGGWAFPDPDPKRRNEQRSAWWRFIARSALRYPWTRVTEGCEAVAIWYPPGGTEFTPEEEANVPSFLRELVGDHSAAFVECLELFETSHPRLEPHYYLSLFATHADHRGQGTGMALLRESLDLIDTEHLAAYLESTNPMNQERYESVGFRQVGTFTPPGGPTVTTMWRYART